MRKILNRLEKFGLRTLYVTRINDGEHVVLLSRDTRFSVCKVQFDRQIALSPNYQSDGKGLIVALFTKAGLDDLLFWTDSNEARQRFNNMAPLPDNVVVLFG
jgi:hypothetical protein